MPTSLAVQEENELRAADVTGLDAAWIPSQPSRRSAAQEVEHSAKHRLIEPTTAAPAATVLPELISPESGRLQLQPPAASGAVSYSTGFGTVAAAGDFGSRALVWSGGGGDSRTAGLLDPHVSRKVDLGPVHTPRAMTESGGGGSFVEQTVDWNWDNDNGSEVTDYVHAVRDYHVGFTPDENDVVQLTLVPNPPNTYQGLVQQVYWTLQVSYSGTGRLRFWNSADKQQELTPSNDWQFWPHQIPRLQGEGGGLPIHIEGIERSDDVGDITINYFELRSYAGVPGWIERGFRPVKVTVAPVVRKEDFKVTEKIGPRYSNWEQVNFPWGDGAAPFIQGRIRFRLDYVPPNNGSLRLVQNALGQNNLIPGNIGMTSGTIGTASYKRFKWELDPARIQNPQTGANETWPVLDWHSPPGSTEPFPFYPIDVRQANPDRGPGWWYMTATDHPRMAKATENGVLLTRIWFSWAFQTYVALTKTERGQAIVTELIALNWTVKFDLSSYSEAQGKFLVNESQVNSLPAAEAATRAQLERYIFNELNGITSVP